MNPFNEEGTTKALIGEAAIKAVEQWLNETDGLEKIQAVEGGGIPIASGEILQLSQQCEWIFIEDMSDVLLARNGVMHPLCLELGWGDRKAACDANPGEGNRIVFVNAYKISDSSKDIVSRAWEQAKNEACVSPGEARRRFREAWRDILDDQCKSAANNLRLKFEVTESSTKMAL